MTDLKAMTDAVYDEAYKQGRAGVADTIKTMVGENWPPDYFSNEGIAKQLKLLETIVIFVKKVSAEG